MLENSKSIYFIKKLFTFVDEKTKSDIIKYNKNMQNIMDINLINYKFYSKKYIIYEENGKGKEYNGYDDSVKFEGEYLNGKRNGKGKEYNGYYELINEGEYLNGKRLLYFYITSIYIKIYYYIYDLFDFYIIINLFY